MSIRTKDLLKTLPLRRKNAHRPVTFEEYLAWPGEAQKTEWVDGKVLSMAPASIRHELAFGFLLMILKGYVQRHNLGTVLGSRVAMKLTQQRRGREPDILFVTRAREHLLRANFLDGPADVVIEIASPESLGRDRGEKFVEYEAAGIPEYWFADVERQQAEFYRLDAAGRYQLRPLTEGIFRSTVIDGFWLRAAWLWELPHELEVLRELGVI